MDICVLSIPTWQIGESSSFDPAFSYIYMICSTLVIFFADTGIQVIFNLSYHHSQDFVSFVSYRTSAYLNLVASIFFLSVCLEWPYLMQNQNFHPAFMATDLMAGLLIVFLSSYFLWKQGEGKRKIIIALSFNAFLCLLSFLSYYFIPDSYFVFTSLLYACSISLFEMRIIGKMQDYSYRKKRGEINSWKDYFLSSSKKER